jgi:hypothetical protein
MTRKRSKFIAAILLCLVTTVSFAQRAQETTWRLVDYVRRAVEVSQQIAAAERSVALAEEKLAETRLSGATALDLDETKLAVTVATLSLAETRNSVAYTAATTYLQHVRLLRANVFAERQLEIKYAAEAVSKQRFEEGVRAEDAYLGDVTSRLNAEIALMQSDQAVESSRRSVLRFADVDVSAPASFVDVTLPFVTAGVDSAGLLAAIRRANSSFVKAEGQASLQRRKLDALSRLTSSVTRKELDSAALAVEQADIALEAAFGATEDQAWQLISALVLNTKIVESGEQLFAVSEKSWEKRNEQFDFGLISAVDLDAYRLAFDQSKDQAVRKIEDHFMHYLRIEQARGTDLVATLGERVR